MEDEELYYFQTVISTRKEKTLLITKETLSELVEENLRFRSVDFPYAGEARKENEFIFSALKNMKKICNEHTSCAFCPFFQKGTRDKLPCGIANISPAGWDEIGNLSDKYQVDRNDPHVDVYLKEVE